MKLPGQIFVPVEKLTNYLLVPREHDDKSQFLAKAGYTQENWQDLLRDIFELVKKNESHKIGKNPYGIEFHVFGEIGRKEKWKVKTVWHLVDGTNKFITLYPWKKK